MVAVPEPSEPPPPRDFPDFFEAEHDRLGRAMFLVVGDAAEAEELAQEAMVRVCERWDRVRRMESPVGYLYRTAFNLNRKRIRRLVVQSRRRTTSDVPDETSRVDDRDEIDRLLARLNDGQRRAVVLIDWLGFSDEDASRVLGIEPVSVRVRVSRAHAALRQAREPNDV